MKKILLGVIVSCMMWFVMLINAYAQNVYKPYDGAKYDLIYSEDAKGIIITGCTANQLDKELGELVIPSQIGGKIVYRIEDSAFKGYNGFSGNLSLPEGIEEIGEEAFNIGLNGTGFAGGKLTLPSTIETVGQLGFAFCSGFTGDLVLPQGLEEIGGWAFWNCGGFTGDLVLPDSLKTLGTCAFSNCRGFDGELTIPEGLEIIGEQAFGDCVGLKGSIVIPNSVKQIGPYAFYGCSGFTGDLVIPQSVELIGRNAFQNCEALGKNIYITGLNLRIDHKEGEKSAFERKNCSNKEIVIHARKDTFVATYAQQHGYSLVFVDENGKDLVVSAPTITKTGSKIVMKTSTEGATIYYTTDGSTPTTSNGIKVTKSSASIDTFSGHVKAIAVKNGYANSDMAKLTLFAPSAKSNVSFGVKGVFGGRNVTFNSDLKGAKIYYSSSTSTLTTKDKCVNVGDTVLFENFYGTIYARTYKDGVWGNACRLILRIPVVNTPSITIDSKGYASIKTTTPSSYLYYTTDGSTPSMTNGKKISSSYGRVYVGKGKTVKAIAVRSCFTHSGVATKR